MSRAELPAITISHLGLDAFRSYAQAKLAVASRLNVFCGANGVGKTNLLEAVAYLALGRSPRTTRDADLIHTGAAGFGIDAHYRAGTSTGGDSGPSLRIAVRYRPEEGRNVWVDGVAASGPGALYGRLLAVFFSPDDLWLLKGGPSARRVLVDRLLVQASPLYADAVRRYRQALAQRNAALREVRARRAGRALLAIWEPQLVQYGGEIMHRRAEAVQALSLLAADVYGDLTGGRETLECRYVPGLGRDGARPVDGQGLAEWRARLEASLSRSGPHDIAMGVTCVGPHRDDMETVISGLPARRFASQGQQRSAVLALKFAERWHLATRTGRVPVMLVDDVLSELDARRRDALQDLLTGEGQVFLTTADEDQARQMQEVALYVVRPGTVSAVGQSD